MRAPLSLRPRQPSAAVMVSSKMMVRATEICASVAASLSRAACSSLRAHPHGAGITHHADKQM